MSSAAEIDLARRAIALLDLTELGDQATEADVVKLCAKARGAEDVPPVAAVCVWPRHVGQARAALDGTGIRIATVVNFPTGEEALPDVLATMQAALEAGAEDVITDDDGAIEVLTAPGDFEAVKNALEAKGLKPEIAEVTMRAENTIALAGDDAARMQKLLDVLEDLDDVQNVFHNAEITE